MTSAVSRIIRCLLLCLLPPHVTSVMMLGYMASKRSFVDVIKVIDELTLIQRDYLGGPNLVTLAL